MMSSMMSQFSSNSNLNDERWDPKTQVQTTAFEQKFNLYRCGLLAKAFIFRLKMVLREK